MSNSVRPEHFPAMIAHFEGQGMSGRQARHQVYSVMGRGERAELAVRLGLASSAAANSRPSSTAQPGTAAYYERLGARYRHTAEQPRRTEPGTEAKIGPRFERTAERPRSNGRHTPVTDDVLRAEWDRSTALQNEFPRFGTYVAYKRVEAANSRRA